MLPYLNVDLDLFYRNVSGMNHTAVVIDDGYHQAGLGRWCDWLTRTAQKN